MCKYILFVGQDFYPFGGWEDFKGYFDDVDSAKTWLKENEPDANSKWAHIVFEDKIICKGFEENSAHFSLDQKKWEWEETNVTRN